MTDMNNPMAGNSTRYDLDRLRAVVVNAAREELLPRFTRVKRGQKADGSVITEADLAMQRRVFTQLEQHWPETACLGEEMSVAEQARMLAANRPLWCLDPLDGTSNFASGIPYFAVSLALLQQGQVSLGLVYDPVRDECFAASRRQGATLNGEPLTTTDTGLDLKQTTALIDFKRLSASLAVRLVTEVPYASQRNFGASALDWCWLSAGRGHLYLHGRQSIWDYSAGHLILREAGGYATTLAGEGVAVNRLEPRSVVAAMDRHLFDAWTAWLGIPDAQSSASPNPA